MILWDKCTPQKWVPRFLFSISLSKKAFLPPTGSTIMIVSLSNVILGANSAKVCSLDWSMLPDKTSRNLECKVLVGVFLYTFVAWEWKKLFEFSLVYYTIIMSINMYLQLLLFIGFVASSLYCRWTNLTSLGMFTFGHDSNVAEMINIRIIRSSIFEEKLYRFSMS